MSFTDFFVMVGIFIVMMLVYKYADRLVARLKPSTVKTVNWIGFGIGILGGVAWYLFGNALYMYLTLLGVIIYFLFYNYDKMEEKEGK